ncbi:ATP-binding cassette domain-containing protein [Methylomonas sp. AM2-LC]|uniref:ABC transporter ATP-binding protein n=1 Tax=Methylomonas sp. AM2-LC TaxID=3153301 RepID=UPI0032634F87
MTSININLHNKTYRSAQRTHTAISELQFQVAANEFVCLVGPSGCGKTTLLNIIAGLDTQYQGQINLENNLTQKIGYVFQNPRLLPWHTVRRNIELVFPDAPPKALIDSLLAAMQITEVQDVYPNQLSLGMQRRAAIIRAFAINPDILLMDEPFVSLDAPTARQIRQLLYSLWLQRPHTVLFVSHDLREAIALADRLLFLSAAPMQIMDNIQVSLSRDERQDETKIESFRQDLLNHYPAIQALL